MKVIPLLASLFAIFMFCGCATKWVPDAESSLNPPVAFQQQFMAEAIDDVFYSMDFSRLSNDLVDIEVMGVYVDGDIADYLRGRMQLELAKAGARSEVDWSRDTPDYKANVMVRVGGVNDTTKTSLFYEWRQKTYTYDVEVAVFSLDGSDYFVQTGKGATEITVSRKLYLLFFPIPLPNQWSTQKGLSPIMQYKQTYDAGKRLYDNPSLARDPNSLNL